MNLRLDDLRLANVVRDREWNPKKLLTLTFRGCETAGELGKACNIIKKLEREALGLVGSRATKEQLAEELADVVICIDLIAMDIGIDLSEAIREKFNKTSTERGLSVKL